MIGPDWIEIEQNDEGLPVFLQRWLTENGIDPVSMVRVQLRRFDETWRGTVTLVREVSPPPLDKLDRYLS